MSTEKEFKWDDNNVKEFVEQYFHHVDVPFQGYYFKNMAEDFKKSKLQSQDKPQPSSIDRIEPMPETKYMGSFEAYTSGVSYGVNWCKKYGIPKDLSEITSAKTTQPKEEDKPVLFITEDGVEIRNGDHAFYVQDDNNWMVVSHSGITEKRPYPYFHTSESANKWVLENKPCLSLNEVKELANNNGAKVLCIPDEKISNYTKQKLNQQ